MDFNERVSRAALQAIQARTFPGCVVGIVKRTGERWVMPFGTFTYDESSSHVEENTIYDTASLTKSIPTGSLALQLIDEGALAVDDRLIDYVPEFRNSDREEVRIKHLLTYTLDGYGLAKAADGGDGRSLHKRTADDILDVLFTRDFERRPGTVFKYTNVPAALLGLVLEKVAGKTLDVLAEERFFAPLSMTRSTFHPEHFSKEEIVPTEVDDWRGVVHGVVHDESAYVCARDDKIVGHAGLFSTAPDILSFLEVLLHSGTKGGVRYFSEEIIEQMTTNQIADIGESAGLGWELYQPRYMGTHATPRTFGKTGFTGTLVVCDIEKGVAYVILSNRIYPHRPSDSSAINAFRKDIGEIVLQ